MPEASRSPHCGVVVGHPQKPLNQLRTLHVRFTLCNCSLPGASAQCRLMAGANGFPASHFAVPDWDVLRGGRGLIAPLSA